MGYIYKKVIETMILLFFFFSFSGKFRIERYLISRLNLKSWVNKKRLNRGYLYYFTENCY